MNKCIILNNGKIKFKDYESMNVSKLLKGDEHAEIEGYTFGNKEKGAEMLINEIHSLEISEPIDIISVKKQSNN